MHPVKFTELQYVKCSDLYIEGKENNDYYQKQKQGTLAALEEAFHIYHKIHPLK
jgi:hypothetical protein